MIQGEPISRTSEITLIVLRPSVRPRARGEKIVARTLSIYTTVDPLSLLARFKRVAKENGATLVGEKESGRFSHEMLRGG